MDKYFSFRNVNIYMLSAIGISLTEVKEGLQVTILSVSLLTGIMALVIQLQKWKK